MIYNGYYITNENGHYKIHLGDYVIATTDTKADAMRYIDELEKSRE